MSEDSYHFSLSLYAKNYILVDTTNRVLSIVIQRSCSPFKPFLPFYASSPIAISCCKSLILPTAIFLSAVLVVSAADGVQSGTNHALSKMDRPFLTTNKVLKDIENLLRIKPVTLQVHHHGEGEDFQGVESLFIINDNGELKRNEDISLDEAWVVLEEAVAMTNDDLLVEYLENGRFEEDKVL